MTKASILRKQSSLAEGVFECERCRRIVPDSQLIVQDGVWLCRDRCAELWSPTENDKKLAAAEALTDPFTPNARAPKSPCGDAPTITSLSPRPIQLAIGGAASTLTVTGVNLSASDSWSYSGQQDISGAVTVNSATSVSIALTAPALDADGAPATAGDYNLIFNGQVIRGAIRTR